MAMKRLTEPHSLPNLFLREVECITDVTAVGKVVNV